MTFDRNRILSDLLVSLAKRAKVARQQYTSANFGLLGAPNEAASIITRRTYQPHLAHQLKDIADNTGLATGPGEPLPASPVHPIRPERMARRQRAGAAEGERGSPE
jgi:hypothetical protein